MPLLDDNIIINNKQNKKKNHKFCALSKPRALCICDHFIFLQRNFKDI